jgi:hypothetical protein
VFELDLKYVGIRATPNLVVAKELTTLADRLGLVVRTRLDSVEMVALPGETAEAICNRYEMEVRLSNYPSES